MTNINELFSLSSIDFKLGLIPEIQLLVKLSTESAKSFAEFRKLSRITGLNTFNCRWPCAAEKLIVVSFPITLLETIDTASHCVGFILPGIIELPGSFAGKIISENPALGPDDNNLKSFEILFNEMGFDNTSGTFDESSVDAWYTAQPANDIDKRHWACKREDHDFDSEFLKSSSRVKDEGAWDIINDLSFLTGGFVCERENGKITYVPYVPSAASVRDLTADDVTDFEQVETYGNLNNQTHLKITNTVQKTDWEPSSTGISASQFGTSSVPAYFGGVEGDSVFTSKIADAQQAHRFPDVSSRAIRIAREVTFSSNLKWEGGIYLVIG